MELVSVWSGACPCGGGGTESCTDSKGIELEPTQVGRESDEATQIRTAPGDSVTAVDCDDARVCSESAAGTLERQPPSHKARPRRPLSRRVQCTHRVDIFTLCYIVSPCSPFSSSSRVCCSSGGVGWAVARGAAGRVHSSAVASLTCLQLQPHSQSGEILSSSQTPATHH